MFQKLGGKLVKLAFTVAIIGISWGFVKGRVSKVVTDIQPQTTISNMVEDLKDKVANTIDDLKDNISDKLDELGTQVKANEDSAEAQN